MRDSLATMQLDDAEIMQRLQAGQLELFEVLVQRYRLPLLRAAWSKLGDPNWADDVVQETFLAVFTARHTYRSEFSFRTWLWTILLNLCSRQWKRQETRPREFLFSKLHRDSGTGASIPEPIHRQTGLAAVLGTERRQQLVEALSRLPEPQADALRLRFFGELKFSEIAQAMESSVSAAKVRVKHGLEALARIFEEKGWHAEDLYDEGGAGGCGEQGEFP